MSPLAENRGYFFSSLSLKSLSAKGKETTEDPATGIEFRVFGKLQSLKDGLLGEVRETVTNDCFDLKVRLQADFVVEIGELSFGRWKCISFFISFSFSFFSLVQSFFFFLGFGFCYFSSCCCFVGFYSCSLPLSRQQQLHNIALETIHGSNYLLLMDIPSTAAVVRESRVYVSKAFFFFLLSLFPFFFIIIYYLFLFI